MHETTVFGDAPWYRERPEAEVRCEGMLVPHLRALGPGSRGGLDFLLRGGDGDQPVYSAGAGVALERLAGRNVVVWGKRVEVDSAVELWPGRIAEA